MKSSNITIVKYEPKKRSQENTDWSRVKALTDNEITAAANSDPDNPPLTPQEVRSMRPILNVAGLRRDLKLTQKEFAVRYKLSVTLVRDWESHRSIPDGAARVLLRLIAHAPDVVAGMLRGETPKRAKSAARPVTAAR